jgi:hypothetical protein
MMTALLQACTREVGVARLNTTAVMQLSLGIADLQLMHKLAAHWLSPYRHLALLAHSFHTALPTDTLRFPAGSS